MAKTYRLEVVLEQRKQALEEARVRLARLSEERERAKQGFAEASARLCEARAHLKERRSAAHALRQAVRSQDLSLEQSYLDRLSVRVSRREEAREEAMARLEQAKRAEAEARDAALAAQRELDAVEKDKGRFLEGLRKERDRREELAADELATARYARQGLEPDNDPTRGGGV